VIKINGSGAAPKWHGSTILTIVTEGVRKTGVMPIGTFKWDFISSNIHMEIQENSIILR